MLSTRSRAVARTGARVLANDPGPIIAMLALPLLLTAFLKPAMAAQLHAAGFAGATGAEQLVPGMAVMFAFLTNQITCTLFYREHYWGTWERLRASGARASELMLGKAIPLFAVILGQVLTLFAVGALVFGYRITGSLLALVVLLVGLVACVIAFGLMVVALVRTLDQAMMLGSLVGMLMAGLGGALAPVSSMPGWAQAVAHVTPTYWGLRGINDVTFAGAGLGDVVVPLAVLLGFAAVCAVVAAARFNPTETKIGTT